METLRSLFPTARRTLVFAALAANARPRNCSQFRPKPRPGIVKNSRETIFSPPDFCVTASRKRKASRENREANSILFCPEDRAVPPPGSIRERTFW